MKIETRLDRSCVPAGAPNIVHVLLTLTAPDQPSGRPRPPLNLAAVIDRSGSMGGEKLAHAKASVRLLLDQLGPHDRFSLVAFDDEVLPLVEGVRSRDQTALQAVVDGIAAGGSTNLSGGWVKGLELAGREAAPNQVNAVLLLTDGQANAGVTDRAQLVALGAGALSGQGIRTSCLGLGRDFEEDLLRDIATAAGGRFSYIESPDQAPEVFREELGGLLGVVAQNVEVELTFSDGVTGVAQLTGHPWKQPGASCHIILGDFHAQQEKHVLLSVRLPAMPDLTDVHLAALRVTYAEFKDGAVQIKAEKRELVVQVADGAAAAAPADPEVLLQIGLQRAAQARRDAVAQLDGGDVAAATQVLEGGRDALRQLAPQAVSPQRLEAEAQELDRRARELHERQDAVDSRKFMVTEAASMGRSEDGRTLSARARRQRHDPPA